MWPSQNIRTLTTVGAPLYPGLFIFYPIFHCNFYCRAVNITDKLCTKQGNSSIKSGFINKSRVGYNGAGMLADMPEIQSIPMFILCKNIIPKIFWSLFPGFYKWNLNVYFLVKIFRHYYENYTKFYVLTYPSLFFIVHIFLHAMIISSADSNFSQYILYDGRSV